MTTTKATLTESIYLKLGFAKEESASLIEAMFEIMKDKLAQGEKIKISGFGNFVVREKTPRIGRNPQTGEEMTIRSRRVLTFKLSQVLKAKLNGGDKVPDQLLD